MRKASLLFLTILVSIFAAAQTPPAEVEQRVEALLKQLTLEEKIDMIGGVNDFYIRAVPRLNLRELRMADGPLGVRNYGESTAYPAGIALAASFDPELVQRVGESIGKDARARGTHFLLAPGVNIYRAPMNGRNFEYFGEDPFLASRTAVAYIKGVQSQGVIATVKHYAANNQEWDRHNVSSDVDERTLREIYLPAFEAAVTEANVGAIMTSYNLVNGTHASQHDWLNNQVAKREWKFDGIIMSDWVSTYDGVAAANGGLDLEMPSARFMNREVLLPAIRDGRVKEATIDDKVRRILRKALQFGFHGREQLDPALPRFSQQARQVALEAAKAGMVLLKNQGNLLPLDRSKVKSLALIGPGCYPAVTGGGGSSRVQPFVAVSFLEGISNYLGTAGRVLYSPGIQPLSEIFYHAPFRTTAAGDEFGLTGEYFDNKDLAGTPVLRRRDRRLDFNWFEGSFAPGAPSDNFSVRWTGFYTPPATGDYDFYVTGDDGYRLYLDDKKIAELWDKHADTLTVKRLRLEGGRRYAVKLEFFEDIGSARLGFGVTAAGESIKSEALQMARTADATVLCVGFNAANEGEGFDRTFQLPTGQDELIRRIQAESKNTIVVLTAGGSVDASQWIDNTTAMVHAWYPGQEGGTALAQLLFGEYSPSGRLPMTFERRWEDNPTFRSYYDPDKDKRVRYTEGVFVGYRGYEKNGVTPLFPFGHGGSYTHFEYGSPSVPRSVKPGQPLTISFTVKNVGKRAGAEVAQVYVSDPQASVPRPAKELKAFTKVFLKPGESRKVTLALEPRALSFFDEKSKQWVAEPGEFEVLVGSSSQLIRFRSKFTLEK